MVLVIIKSYFPEFGADLVTALAGLDVDEFTHFGKGMLNGKNFATKL